MKFFVSGPLNDLGRILSFYCFRAQLSVCQCNNTHLGEWGGGRGGGGVKGSERKEMRFLRRGELQLRKKGYDKSFFESKKKKKNGAVRNGRNAKKKFLWQISGFTWHRNDRTHHKSLLIILIQLTFP